MHDRVPMLVVRLLHRRRLDDVPTLLKEIQFHQAPVLLIFILDLVEFLLVYAVYVADVAEPGVEAAYVGGCQRSLDTAAFLVPAGDDVLDV
jgi:hypothetical protein